MRGLFTRLIVVLFAVGGIIWMSGASVTPAGAAASCTGVSGVVAYHGGFYNARGFPVAIPTIGFNTWNDNCELGVGNDSSGVWWLQYDLNHCYGQHLAQDGDYGPLTQAAVRYAQRLSGATPDGIYGPQTEHSIKWVDYYGFYAGDSLTCAPLPSPPPQPV